MDAIVCYGSVHRQCSPHSSPKCTKFLQRSINFSQAATVTKDYIGLFIVKMFFTWEFLLQQYPKMPSEKKKLTYKVHMTFSSVNIDDVTKRILLSDCV